MPGQEIEHGTEHRRVAKASTQRFGREACQREQALGTAFTFKQPAERAQGQRLRISGG